MAVVAGDRRRNPSGAILRCKAALRRPTTAHPRAHQSVKIFLAASHTVTRRNVGPAIDDGDPGIQPGKGGPQVAQYSTVQPIPTASHSRLRHLALLCDHADIAPRSIFSLPLPLSIDLLRASGTNRGGPPPLPSSVPVAGSFEIAWFGFRFPRFRSFATL